MKGHINSELLKPPPTFEVQIERVGFYFKIPRKDILWGMDLEELFRYHGKCFEYLMESQGRKMKKKTSFADAEFEKERRARLNKQYGEE